jgi:SHS2 domain-containing protein
MAEGFRTFDHTGDLGLEVWAETRERLYGLAAEALMMQVIEARDSAMECGVTLDLEGDDPADLLVHWLNTALLHADLEGAVWVQAAVELPYPTRLRGTLLGPRRDPKRQAFLREIKAVSHHFLSLDLEPPECRCRLILDI